MTNTYSQINIQCIFAVKGRKYFLTKEIRTEGDKVAPTELRICPQFSVTISRPQWGHKQVRFGIINGLRRGLNNNHC
ncbi:hypothetical protein [Marivirga sp.]|uniref:hypothetical protein n=1 Tax=Marivirga sp. TaxID=2018662 RepID=UPI0025E4A6FD|nr:hypothetical protein [Marivirga sp.]